MVFAFSFGAFGDIVVAADLALRVSKALSSSRGSTYDYQYLIQELDALAHILRVAEAATRTGLLERTTVNSLNAEVLRCRDVIEHLSDQVRKYQKALGSGTKATNGIEASWRKIGWGLFKTEEVRETRAKLTTHRLNLIMLMTACNQSRLDKLLAQNTQLESSMDVVTTQVKELTVVMRQLPTKLGYARPNAITIQDPFGTNTLLPMALCENPQQFDDMLALVSSKWPALMRQTIKTGNYVPICVEAGARLDHADEAEWMSSVVPGRTIRISYLVDWHPTSMTGQALGKLLQFVVCADCERGGGPRRLLPPQGQTQLMVVGCSSEAADWKVSVEDVWNARMNAPVLRCTFHHPTFPGCKADYASVSVAVLRDSEMAAMGDYCNALMKFLTQRFGIRDTRKCAHAHGARGTQIHH